MEVIVALLCAAAVLTAGFAVLAGREQQRTRAAEALSAALVRGRRHRPQSAVPRRRGTRASAVVRVAQGGEQPLPWPFSALDTLQQRAGEYDGPMRILLTIALAAAGLGICAWLLTGQPMLTALAALSGVLAPAVLLRAKAAKRLSAMEDQVSGVCLRLSQALGAGSQVERALAEVARETAAPFGDELRLVMRDVAHGTPLDAALSQMVRRLPEAPSVRMLVASMQISLEMGADLAAQLRSISEIIRDRRIAHARIAGVTATARIQTKVLAVVPLAAYAWAHFYSPATVAGYQTPLGYVKLAAMAGWVVLGYLFAESMLASAFSGVL